jgi:PilZ domain-containing protein
MSQERRRDARMNLTLPVKVFGHDPGNVAWEEMGTVDDVSASGVGLHIRRALRRGQVLLLLVPLPKRFRRYDTMEPSYRTYGLVRNVITSGPTFRVGVMFLGKHPPRTYDKDPAGLYLLPGDPAPASKKERRRHERLDIFVNFRLRRTDDGPGPREEPTIAENISRGGARVLTSLAVEKGAVLEIEELGGDFRARARVKNLYVGPDHVARLNLEFIDAVAPDRLVATQK